MTDHPAPDAASAPATPPATVRTPGFRAELRDAVTPRTVVLVLAVLAIQLGFIASYIGAFHAPSPHGVPIAVTVAEGVTAAQRQAADAAVARTVTRLNAVAGTPLDARAATSVAAGRAGIDDRDVDGVLVLDPTGTADRLLTSGASSSAVADLLPTVLTRVEATQQRTLAVTDVKPVGEGDSRGLSSFYLAIGWVVGGYLAAALLGVAAGARPVNRRRAAIRLGALGAYAVASGVLGAVVVQAIVPAFSGHVAALAAFGALVVFASASVTVGFQSLLGVAGIGVVIVLFVVLGNPSAGGPYPGVLLPTFWRAIGPFLAPGAGTTGVRGITYFGGAGLGLPLVVLAVYAVGGAVLAVLASRARPSAGHHVTV